MFSKVVGQRPIIDYIIQSKAENHLAHTILLSGLSGYGLFELGRSIANYILCHHPGTDSCGSCAGCKKMLAMQHPDFHLFFPTAKAKETSALHMKSFREMWTQVPSFDFSDWLEFLGESNKTLNINTDIVKEINHAFSFKSFEDGPRVYMIWGAEYLGKEGNKLLKVIEEPPEDAFIILLSANRQAILPTILSRCQLHLLKPLSVDDLLSGAGLDENEENIKLANRAQGDLRRMLDLTTNEQSDYHGTWLKYMRTAFKGHPTEVIEFSTTLANAGKEKSRQYLKYGIGLVGQMLRSNVGIPTENEAAVEKLAQLLSLEDLEAIYNRLQKDYGHVNRNANLKLLFASQSLWLTEMFRKKKKSAARA